MAYTKPEKTWAANDVLTAAQLNTYLRDQLDVGFPDGATSAAYAPELRSSTGAVDHVTSKSGREWQVGPWQFVSIRWSITSLGDSGVLVFTLPSTPANVTAGSTDGQALGSYQLVDASAGASSISGTVYLGTSTTARFRQPTGNNVSDTSPFSLASGDVLTCTLMYPVA